MVNLQAELYVSVRARLCLVMLWLLPVCPAHADFSLRVQTDLGGFDMVMYENDAANTVANFMDYVNNGDYDGMLFHRYAESPPGTPFVLQTGGYYFDPNLGPFFAGGAQEITPIRTIPNQFGRSNTRGTIAMAKLPGNPDSADSEWFINLADNSANLDTQNGGFTVFAEVLGNGMKVIDEIVSFGVLATCVDYEPVPGLCGAFSNMPFRLQANQFFFDNDTLFNIHSIGPDADGDGAIDGDEIDGDGAGGPDSGQPNVASAPMLETPTDYITVATPSAANPLADFTVLGNTFRITRPEISACVLNGVDLAYGLTSFQVSGFAVGGSIAVDVILPQGSAPDAYYFYGPEWLAAGTYDAAEHWHQASGFNGMIGADINGNRVTLHLVDGGWGDADMTADGVITVAPGGGASNVAPAVLADGDCDGVGDNVENDPANNNGDGNNDNNPDDMQSGVASLPDINGNYLTVEAITPQVNVENVRQSDGQIFFGRASVIPLNGLNLPSGFMDFAVSNVVPGGAEEIKIILPAAVTADRFYLLGPDAGDQSEHWYNFIFDAASGSGTVVNGNEVTLHFVDGGRGDRDRAANGVIYIIGVPAEVIAASTTGSGGGCSLSGVARSPRQAGAWWLLLGLFATRVYWRRQRSGTVYPVSPA
jgi:cyclophilin family peptidyl-prolyl cis-trans isomerase